MHFFYSPDSNRICLVDTDDNGPFNIFRIANCLARSIKFHFPMGSNGITLGTLKNQTTDFVVLAHVGAFESSHDLKALSWKFLQGVR